MKHETSWLDYKYEHHKIVNEKYKHIRDTILNKQKHKFFSFQAHGFNTYIITS